MLAADARAIVFVPMSVIKSWLVRFSDGLLAADSMDSVFWPNENVG